MVAYQAGFEALADSTRRAIFESIADHGRSVGEIAGALPVSRPAVSQHLKVLKDAGLVTVRAVGTRRIYAVDPAGLTAIREYFDRFWTNALADFAVAAERSTPGSGTSGPESEKIQQRKGTAMTQLDLTTSIRATIEVAVPPERAFEVFTVGIDSWWNRQHYVQDGQLKAVGVDPFVGGRVWEENDAGDVCVFGRVLGWDRGRKFVFSWLIGPDWAVPAPDAPASTVTVTFTPTETGTLVELVHTDLDRHGTDWQDVHHALGAETGWADSLRAFEAAVQV